MSTFKQEAIYQQAKKWVKEAGALIRQAIDQPREIDTKADANDLVTEMDKKIEQFFAEHIRHTYPTDRILSEEGFGDEVNDLTGTVWIIDPIDGTMNFVHQKRTFSISLAVYHNGIGEIGFVYDVMADILYHAKKGAGAYKNEKKLSPIADHKNLSESILMLNTFWCTSNNKVNDKKIRKLVQTVRGTRTYGSAALEFAYLAEGIVDSYISFKLHPWDLAAGVILFNEVGGKTVQANGKPLTFLNQDPMVSAHPDIIDEIINDYIELK
ncbi:inositol monophosphatase family protein [Amphibacillus cookii]|uniref:inositol monophosphatase family protein n=1 Tax=Amphibacillus cookii TaxID=767787 RepID=UPI00195C1A27|nr:inositol monophosphatase family protein [Amphibacillus cookii]MBM7540445.1 myo-inositol-1(or 4)-monophosphatase [Amphibacillus cookii]